LFEQQTSYQIGVSQGAYLPHKITKNPEPETFQNQNSGQNGSGKLFLYAVIFIDFEED